MKKGNPVSPIYQQLFEKAVTTLDWIEIINKAKEQALDGDKGAREWLSQYMVTPIAKMQENNSGARMNITIVKVKAPLPQANKEEYIDVKEYEWKKT